MRLKTWHGLALLMLVVLLAYYPSLFSGYNSVDDLKMISSIDRAGPLQLQRLFVRSNSYYYRPLTILSYTLDRDLWGSVPSFMHLENILLHLACVWLVFVLTKRLLPLWGVEGQGLALFSAFFFALHPLATESICWISGRTDPLMTLFLLLAVWLTVLALLLKSSLAALAGGVALFLACLAKEVAVFILPGLLWLVVIFPEASTWFVRLRRRCLHLLVPITAVCGYFILRHLAIARDSGVGTALKGVTGGDYDLLNKVRVAFKVYGFYFKKLFIPWPLNFGIVEVSGLYALAGIGLAVLLIYLAYRADVPGAFGLMAFCTLSPALLVVFGNMTWTPIAERYLYTSIALFAPLAAYIFLRYRTFVAASAQLWFNLALAALLLLFFATSLHRTWIWQDNLRLYRDTVTKSPGFVAAKSELASALMRRGKEDEAEEILAGMQEKGRAARFINDDMNLALILLSKGEPESARQVLMPLLKTNHKKYYDLLQLLIRINDQRLGRAADPSAKMIIHQESLGWLLEQQHLRPRAFTLYRIGKRYLAMGNEGLALEFFKKAYAQAPADAHFQGAAATFIRRLEGGEGV